MKDQSRQIPDIKLNSWKSIPALFEETVERHASLEAVRSPQSVLSYRELERISRQLASMLCRKVGMEPQPVALLIEDSAQVIASLLGVIRSGHFYCALSHNDPPARLMWVLRDLEAKILVTDKQSLSLAERIVPSGCELLLLSDILETGEIPLPATFTPETLLGIFYTSGSTGEPKGVLRNHSYVLHRLEVELRDYSIGAGDKLLFMKQFNVSSSLGGIFNVLLTGATLISYDTHALGIGPLADLLNKEQITIFNPPIELLRHFLYTLQDEVHFNSIRIVKLGGDVLFKSDVEKLRLHLSEKALVVHHLSSSESGLLARTILHQESQIAAEIVPVGFPVIGKEILILGQDGKQLTDGTTGEIAVRSELVFAGYWRQPDLSAAKFRPDPGDPAKKVFCTGDLGYFLPDGQLVFVGRNDFRVKIRGFSVDCASVESELMVNPLVRRAVVVPQEDPAGNKRLVGYIIPAAGVNLEKRQLRDYLREKLPDYMVPSTIVLLDALPLTPNGKIDRKALAALEADMTGTGFQPPNTELEIRLAKIWSEVLGCQAIGMGDDFLDIGGNSLLAARVAVRIQREFNVGIPLVKLFEVTCLANLATLVEREIQSSGQSLDQQDGAKCRKDYIL